MDRILFLAIAFLNAFVDMGHKITLQNVVFTEYSGSEQIILIGIINLFILLPFLFFFTPSGFISDKYPKNKIIKYGGLSAVIITTLILVSYYLNIFTLALGLTLILAIQSAIYSPAKLGYIRDLVQKNEISKLNAYLQSVSIIGILAGMAFFSFIFTSNYNSEEGLLSLVTVGYFLIAFSLIEYLFSLKLPTKTEEKIDMSFNVQDWITLKSIKSSVNEFRKNDVIVQSMIGLAFFWLILQLISVTFPSLAKANGIDNVLLLNSMLATTGIGIFFGSLLFSKISKNYIEIGVIPIGAIGLAISTAFITFNTNTNILFLAFFFAGLSGGLFIVPLNSLIQFNVPKEKLGITMAGANWIQSLFMTIGLTLTTLVAYFQIDPQYIMISVLLIAIGGSVYTFFKIPQAMIHFVIGLAFHTKYKIQVSGINNIPSKGPILMLGNHVSWIDWALLQIASPRRIRFLMDKAIFNKWYLNKFLKFFGAIPVNGASKDSLKLVSKYLLEGEVVCIFPEGAITRNGQLGEFKKGFEKILDFIKEENNTAKIPVLPFYIRGMWGDKYSRAEENYKKSWNSETVTVIFGNTLISPNTAKVKQEIFNLSACAWREYSKTFESIPVEIIRNLKRENKEIIIDSSGVTLDSDKLMTAAISFKQKLKLKNKNIGLLLPPSAGGIIVNFAVLLLGKTLVNLNYTSSVNSLISACDQADIKSIVTSRKFIEKLKGKGIDLDKVLENKDITYAEDIKSDIKIQTSIINLMIVKLLPTELLINIFVKKQNTEDTAVILFSSGSEGEPKGIELTHTNLIGNVKQTTNVLNPKETDKILGILPIFHAFGITVTTLLPLLEGIPVVTHADPTDAKMIGKLVAKNKVTIMAATSTFLRLYTVNRRVNRLMFESLRIVIAGAEKLDLNVKTKFFDKFGKEILEGFGATETSPVASVNLPDILTPDLTIQIGNKTGTVGLPIPGTAFKIVDPHDLEEYKTDYKLKALLKGTVKYDLTRLTLVSLNTNEAGMLLISGPQLMKGYLNNEEKTNTATVISNGIKWYITGDKAKLDEDGFLTIVDRYSRFAKIAGEMISLTAVEQEIGLFISEIEYIAVAIPDSKKGEQIVLVYEDQEDLIDIKNIKTSLNEKMSNKLMIPGSFFKVEELPKLGTGKKDFKRAKELVLERKV